MKTKRRWAHAFFLVLAFGLGWAQHAVAQTEPMRFATVERPPFATEQSGEINGFSIDLMTAIAEEMGRDVTFEMTGSFAQMLTNVETGAVDGAIANISITRERESRLDFSLPIYNGGLRIMVQQGNGQPSLMRTLFSAELALAVFAAFGLLFAGGMLMWVFERGKQPYFDRPAREAMFPAFWWALNLVVNGGFEERMPRSGFGRFFATLLVVSSLFIVSVFVAHITAATTVEAISGAVHSVSDLDGKRVGTTRDSTASRFLRGRDVTHTAYLSLDDLLESFEQGNLDAVVFDAPILDHYLNSGGARFGETMGALLRPEDYGIALPSGSDLREPVNVALLRLIETGAYQDIEARWFGSY